MHVVSTSFVFHVKTTHIIQFNNISPKGGAYSRRFVHLSGTLASKQLENCCWYLNKTWYIDRWQ